LLDVGRNGGMKAGFPVVDANGLVGRLIETGTRASRVLLITDINSRIPVQVGKTAVRALLLGDNGPRPRLGHLPAEAAVAEGDEVFTSGTGGLLPRGLRIGTVVMEGEFHRVRPHAGLDELEFVSILLFEAPVIDLGEDERAPAKEPAPKKAMTKRSLVPAAGTTP
jgi:rod shape-determining protein MreC